MNYNQAMDYMDSLKKYGSVPGLDTVRLLCEKTGNPQDRLSFVHIAGTNGKGSVLAFISAIMKAAGYRTGSYCSPSFLEYRDRFRVNGRIMSRADFAAGVEQMRVACQEIAAQGHPHPTQFEVDTALAFHYFDQKKCRIVILETGMGGRQDATNIINNTLAAVFTPIGMDHMQYLGSTPAAIAREKAGIIKKNSRVICAMQSNEVIKQLTEACKESGNTLIKVTDQDITAVRYGLKSQRFSYRGMKNLEITMTGNYQIENGALALAAVHSLSDLGFPVPENKLRQGLKDAVWPGRFQVIGRKPYFLVDGAHNRDGAEKLAQSIQFHFTNKKIVYIMGVLADKEYNEVIARTYKFARQIITCTPQGQPRALPAYELAQAVSRYHDSVTAADSLEEAVELSYLLAGPDSVIIAFGSLSYLGDISRIVENRHIIRSDVHGKSGKN